MPLYNKIFLSHSKDDTNINFFHKVVSGIRTELIAVELEDIKVPPGKYIQDRINKSDALFISLSKPLERLSYTRNWVSYEIGLAANRSKPSFRRTNQRRGIDIFVFEPFGSKIDFPIPYFDFYLKYKNDDYWIKYIRTLLTEGIVETHGTSYSVECSNDLCKIIFAVDEHIMDLEDIYCPACRKKIDFE